MARMLSPFCRIAFALTALAATVSAGEIPVGKIVDRVECLADDAQSYALYLPSNYKPDRDWKLILAFDAGARGRQGVERFQAAAEKFGYIVAGSNNSRNGSWDISLNAAEAMAADVVKRFKIDRHHMYTTGQSGGARVAMKVAMESGNVTGVIASSAGFPDPSEPESTLNFPVYGTAGTEDFNYLEMRNFDNQLTSSHHLEIFEGGHTWLSSDLAMRAIEWMELEAIKIDISPRNPALVKEVFEKRLAEAKALKSDFARLRALNTVVIDFQALTDVAAVESEAVRLQQSKATQEAARADNLLLGTEERTTNDLFAAVRTYVLEPSGGIRDLRIRVMPLFEKSQAEKDSEERRMARRVLAGLRASSRGIEDKEYQKLLAEIQLAPRPQ